MASRSSGRNNSASKGFDFATTDDFVCSYEDYGNQDNYNGRHSDSVIGSNSAKLFNVVCDEKWLLACSISENLANKSSEHCEVLWIYRMREVVVVDPFFKLTVYTCKSLQFKLNSMNWLKDHMELLDIKVERHVWVKEDSDETRVWR
ncbi:unnamed protein product [Camellia sinensis]